MATPQPKPLPDNASDIAGRKVEDLTGHRVNMLTVLGFYRLKTDEWVVQCDCGVLKVVAGKTLKSIKLAYSCGCEKATLPDLTEQEARTRASGLRSKGAKIEYQEIMDLHNVEGRKCIVCGCLGDTNKLNIDHDHASGRVRGLLCTRCNTVLGAVKDSARLLLNLVVYLLKYRILHFFRRN